MMSVNQNQKPVKTVIRWFGGKTKLAKDIIPLFPPHHCYVEPFAGSAGVLVQKPMAMSKVEVVNDIDCDLVNFWMQLRSRRDELIADLASLPTSRYLCEKWQREPLPEDPYQLAIVWFYLNR